MLFRSGGATITAIADPNQGSRELASKAAGSSPKLFENYQDLLETNLVDAVVIATPNDTHVNVLEAALATDIAVFIEKPLATTVADCKKIIDWDSQRKALTWMGLEYRFMPPVNEVIQRSKAGAVGKVHQVSIREHREPFYPKVDNWNRFTTQIGRAHV